MEQLYMIEILLDKVTIYAADEDEKPENKNLVVKFNFGPTIQLVVREAYKEDDEKDKAKEEKEKETKKKKENKAKEPVTEKEKEKAEKEKAEKEKAEKEKKEKEKAEREKRHKDSQKAKTIKEKTEDGKTKWSRSVRIGKSYIFPSYPDTLMKIVNKFPLEIEVWNDDIEESEKEIFVGIGTLVWDRKFYSMLKESAEACKSADRCWQAKACATKQTAMLTADGSSKTCGEVDFILRIQSLGEYIITEFLEKPSNQDNIYLRATSASSTFECKKSEGEDINFLMVGSIFESTTLEDPTMVPETDKIIEICTDLQSCKTGDFGDRPPCSKPAKPKKKYPIDKIRMGDIVGPCGNANCALAHKVRRYIRTLETYKNASEKQEKKKDDKNKDDKEKNKKPVCGTCVCKDEKWHRETCPDYDAGKTEKKDSTLCEGCGGYAKKGYTCGDKMKTLDAVEGNLVVCPGCGGGVQKGETCAERSKECDTSRLKTQEQQEKTKDKSVTVKDSKETTKDSKDKSKDLQDKSKDSKSKPDDKDKTKQVNYVLSLPKLPGYDYNKSQSFYSEVSSTTASSISEQRRQSPTRSNVPEFMREIVYTENDDITSGGCSKPTLSIIENFSTTLSPEEESTEDYMTLNKPAISIMCGTISQVYNVATSSKKTENCTDPQEDKSCKCKPPKPHPPCATTNCECLEKIDAVQSRKQHRPFCPLFKHKDLCPVSLKNEEEGIKDEEEDVAEPLPYGLPPVKLGPCPVMGRPCSVPDGFARMYKNALVPPLPPSYTDAGKVCCYREYEKIKKALKEYMKYEKEKDFRCINKFNVDTETRCCDKEQKLFSMLGRGCCGAHKLSVQEKFKNEK